MLISTDWSPISASSHSRVGLLALLMPVVSTIITRFLQQYVLRSAVQLCSLLSDHKRSSSAFIFIKWILPVAVAATECTLSWSGILWDLQTWSSTFKPLWFIASTLWEIFPRSTCDPNSNILSLLYKVCLDISWVSLGLLLTVNDWHHSLQGSTSKWN